MDCVAIECQFGVALGSFRRELPATRVAKWPCPWTVFPREKLTQKISQKKKNRENNSVNLYCSQIGVRGHQQGRATLQSQSFRRQNIIYRIIINSINLIIQLNRFNQLVDRFDLIWNNVCKWWIIIHANNWFFLAHFWQQSSIVIQFQLIRLNVKVSICQCPWLVNRLFA